MITMKMAGDTKFERLEAAYAIFVGSKYAVSVNSGTSALHLALVALGVGPGDEVIIPDFTMAACAFAVSYTGAKPIFVDCGSDLNINVDLIEEKITPNTKVIMPVHIYGRLCNMTKIMEIAEKYNLKVVEDACEAQGAVFRSKAHITCYSFYQNKIINAEEGGMIVTNNENLSASMQNLKSMAFGKTHNYFHYHIGFNYRMPESQAALALKSLGEYSQNNKKRRQIETWFDTYLNKDLKMPKRDAVWVYDFIPRNMEKTKIIFKKQKIQFREFFKPISSFPMYRTDVGINAKEFGHSGLYLVIDLNYTEVDIMCITQAINKISALKSK